jgi:hypothetical protein
MFFVVRTDVDAQSGLQRMMGLYDDAETAWRFVDALSETHRGEFKVFGNAIEIARPVANGGKG